MKTYSVIQSEESSKTISIKRKILQSYLTNGNSTIADICKEMELSVPTVTKLIGELQEEQLIKEFGKLDRNGGRRPSVYGLNPEAGYFVGVEIMNDHLNIGVVDFSGHYIKEFGKTVSFTVENSSSNFEALCVIIGDFLEGLPQEYARVFNVGITISGRVNPEKGLSYTLYDFVEEPLAKVLSQRLGVKVLLDNDTRAMGYGEFHHGVVDKEKNVIFLNFCWGFGISIIIDGVPYFGKSGFSGELGHMSYFDNEIICQCGKKGCVETEVSGCAVDRILREKYKSGTSTILADKIKSKQVLSIEDIIQAVKDEDTLAIEIVEDASYKMGKIMAGMINVFNPDLVVLGGPFAKLGEYIRLPFKSAVKKYSINLVNKDTEIKTSTLENKSGVVGICLIARARMLELM